jgi:HK97 family phage portal protein
MKNLTEGGWSVLTGSLPRKEGDWKDLSDREKENAFTSSVVFSCLSKINNTVGSAPLKLLNKNPGGAEPEEVLDHPVLDLLRRPNAGMTTSAFLQQNTLHLLLTGENYLWKGRVGAPLTGEVNRIWPLPTSWVKKKFNMESGELVQFDVQKGRQIVQVPPKDMVLSFLPDPRNPLEGIAPLEAAAHDYEIDCERENYLRDMLRNRPVAGVVFKQEGGWTEPQKQEIRNLLRDSIGPGHRGAPLFVGGESAGVDFPQAMGDLDWPGLSSLTETRICATFGVPPIIIGLRSGLDRSTYSNYEQALCAFYQNTMDSLWKFLAEALTMGLLWEEGEPESLHLTFDTSQIPQMRSDMTDKSAKLFAGGIVSRNEARAMNGLDPLEGEDGDVFLVPANNVENPLGGFPHQEGNYVPADGTPKPEENPDEKKPMKPSGGVE